MTSTTVRHLQLVPDWMPEPDHSAQFGISAFGSHFSCSCGHESSWRATRDETDRDYDAHLKHPDQPADPDTSSTFRPCTDPDCTFHDDEDDDECPPGCPPHEENAPITKVWALMCYDPWQYQGRANTVGLYATEAGAEAARVLRAAEIEANEDGDKVYVMEYEVEA